MEKEDQVNKLAQMTADEFQSVRREMANKDDVHRILEAINDLNLHVNAWMSDTEHRFKDVEQRIHVLESKTGLRR